MDCLLQWGPTTQVHQGATVRFLYLSASALRPSVVRCQCCWCCCCCCCLWSCRGRGPRVEGSGPTDRRRAGNREPSHPSTISSLFCPTAAYFLLGFVFRSSEESVVVGSVPDAALTGRASLTSPVTYALTRCGSLWLVVTRYWRPERLRDGKNSLPSPANNRRPPNTSSSNIDNVRRAPGRLSST